MYNKKILPPQEKCEPQITSLSIKLFTKKQTKEYSQINTDELIEGFIHLQIKFPISCCGAMIAVIDSETTLFHSFVISQTFFASQTN